MARPKRKELLKAFLQGDFDDVIGPPTLTEQRAVPPHPERVAGGCGQPDRCDLTLLTVTYNGLATLPETLLSVRAAMAAAQSDGLSVEYIVVDGRSPYGTLDLLQEHAEWIHLFISEPDRGMYDAVNKGLALARGAVVHLVNADDPVPEGALQAGMRPFRDGISPDVLVKGDLQVMGPNGAAQERLTRFNRAPQLPKGFPLLHPSWFVPLALYEKYGLYRTDFFISADKEYFYRALRAGVEVVHVDEVLGSFSTGGMSADTTALFEVLCIEGRYLGRRRAASNFVRMVAKKKRRVLLEKVLGEDAEGKLRTQWHQWRTGARG